MQQSCSRFLTSGLLLAACLTLNWGSYARPDYLASWVELYPNAKASELNCQLCHEQASGGDGWNGYGFDVRNTFIDTFGSSNIKAAIAFIENLNSDVDPKNLSNLNEISTGLFPGWVNSPTNTVFFKDSTFKLNQAPPTLEGLSDESQACFPIKAKSDALSLICL